MTLSFKCPGCGGLCAFADKYAGRRARCQKCDEVFLIPAKQGDTAERVKTEPDVPIEGFYRAALVSFWRLFFNKNSTTGLVFVAALVSLRFFIGHTDYSFTMPGFRVQLPTGQITWIISWGLLFWYYMETVAWVGFDYDGLPEVAPEGFFSFIWNIIKSLYLFLVALIFAELPFLIVIKVLRSAGVQTEWVFHVLVLCGLFVFPINILFLSAGPQLWMVFRLDYIYKPIVRAFVPYTNCI